MKTMLFCAELVILKMEMTSAVSHLTQCVACTHCRNEGFSKLKNYRSFLHLVHCCHKSQCILLAFYLKDKPKGRHTY